jgi:peptide/nickel transport system permease protein
LAQCVLVVLAATTLSFVLLRAAPGDPFDAFDTSPGLTAEMRAEQRIHYGADLPVLQQYAMWISNAARGDLGWSILSEQPVSDAIMDALPPTLFLMGLAFAASLIFGVLLGAWQGAHAGSRADRMLSALTLGMYSLPEFALGIGLLLLFVTALRWLPASGMVDEMYGYMGTGERIRDRLEHLVLPWATLTIVGTGVFARFQRAAMRDAMDEPFVRTARAKGLSERKVRGHALRASLLPIITLAGLLFPALLGGAVLVEKVFGWPGMGKLLFDAIGRRDYWLVTGAVVIGSTMTALGTLLADIVRTIVDPRVTEP